MKLTMKATCRDLAFSDFLTMLADSEANGTIHLLGGGTIRMALGRIVRWNAADLKSLMNDTRLAFGFRAVPGQPQGENCWTVEDLLIATL